MAADQDVRNQESGEVLVEASGKRGAHAWNLRATGRAAAYILLGAPVLFLLAQSGPIPGRVVGAMIALGILAVRFGVDVAGSQNRRMEEEINRYKSEIDRLAAERNKLQASVLQRRRSSRRRGRA